MIERIRARFLPLACSLWGLLVGGGMYRLYDYEHTPGPRPAAPAQWPVDSPLARAPDRPTLLVFLHPHCPCSRATVGELGRLLARVNGRVAVHVIFSHDAAAPADWAQTVLWDQASQIPGVSVCDDIGCVLTRRFGATTSGATLLYDHSGRLWFSGGITGSRGHAGDNLGSAALLDSLSADNARAAAALRGCSVFGCPLFDREDASAVAQGSLR